jgi:hypothetical protein
MTIKEIALKLRISRKTVEFHWAGLCAGLQLRDPVQIALWAVAHGLLEVRPCQAAPPKSALQARSAKADALKSFIGRPDAPPG